MKARKYAVTTESAIRALVAEGLTNNVIAERLNVSATALATVRSMLGIVSTPKRPSFGVKAWWLPAMAAGATVETISKAEGVTYPTVYGALKRAGLPTTRKDAAEYMAATAGKGAQLTAADTEQSPLALVA